MRRVVITGFGLMSIMGIDKNAHQILFENAERIQPVFDENYWDLYFDGKTGRIPTFDPKKYIKNAKSIKFMSRQTVLGCTVMAQAIQDACLSEDELKKEEYQNALVYGAGVGDSIFPFLPAVMDCIDDNGNIDYQKLGENGYRNLPPLWILEKLPNTTAAQISVQNSIRGTNYTIVNGPLNSILSIAQGYDFLINNRANCLICGGAEAYINADYLYKLKEEGVISLSENGLMPFDENSDGCYITEGAGGFVLEDEQTAIKRGAKIYARILSYNNSYLPYFSNSNTEYTALRFEKCMRKALDEAGLSIEEIDFIQANACGDKRLDLPEAVAIRNVFGSKVPVTACSSWSGYTIGSSGAISVAYGIMQIENNCILPIGRTTNFFLQDKLNYVKDKMIKKNLNNILINTFSYMGDACTIILTRGGI